MATAKDGTAADAGGESAGDAYITHLEGAAAALRQLLLTLDGAPGVSPYTAGAIAGGKKALADLDG